MNPCGCGHSPTQHQSKDACRECICPEYHEDRRIVLARINDTWDLMLPEHRAYRSEWPVWEKERISSMHEHLRPGDVLYDIGAEEGDMPALFATWGCKLVLVEPNPKVWPCIRACWEANQLEKPQGWWVGFASDVIDEHPPKEDVDSVENNGWPNCAYGEVIPWHGFRHLAQQADATPQMTIDQLAQRFGPPDAITVDVEGAELHVLRGALQVLSENKPKVWVSVHPEFMHDLYQQSDDELYSFMDNVGYNSQHLATDHETHVCFTHKSA